MWGYLKFKTYICFTHEFVFNKSQERYIYIYTYIHTLYLIPICSSMFHSQTFNSQNSQVSLRWNLSPCPWTCPYGRMRSSSCAWRCGARQIRCFVVGFLTTSRRDLTMPMMVRIRGIIPFYGLLLFRWVNYWNVPRHMAIFYNFQMWHAHDYDDLWWLWQIPQQWPLISRRQFFGRPWQIWSFHHWPRVWHVDGKETNHRTCWKTTWNVEKIPQRICGSIQGFHRIKRHCVSL